MSSVATPYKEGTERRHLVLSAYRELEEADIREAHEYLNPPNMTNMNKENIPRDEVKATTLALLEEGERIESDKKGGHTVYSPAPTLEGDGPYDW